MQRVDERLEGFTPKASIKRTRQELKQLILPELRENAQFHAPYPQQPFNTPPILVSLFAGVHEEMPWILEIERDGRDEMFGAQVGHFHAIGSGAPAAHTLMRTHLKSERTLELGKVFAYRIL